MPSFGDRKKWDQRLVPATSAGKIAWVVITFLVSLSQELSWNALFSLSSLVYIPLALWFASVLHCSVPADLIWGAQSCGISGASGNRQPEPQAGSRGTQRFPEAGSGMLNPPVVARGIY